MDNIIQDNNIKCSLFKDEKSTKYEKYHGSYLDGIFDHRTIHKYECHNSNYYKLPKNQEISLASIKTTIRFEDTKYVPGLETCCQACGDHMAIKEQQENENENAPNNRDYSREASD